MILKATTSLNFIYTRKIIYKIVYYIDSVECYSPLYTHHAISYSNTSNAYNKGHESMVQSEAAQIITMCHEIYPISIHGL